MLIGLVQALLQVFRSRLQIQLLTSKKGHHHETDWARYASLIIVNKQLTFYARHFSEGNWIFYQSFF